MVATRFLIPARRTGLCLLLLTAAPTCWAQAALPDPMRPALTAPASPDAPAPPPQLPPPSPSANQSEAAPPRPAPPPPLPPPRLQGIMRSPEGIRVLVDGQLLIPGKSSGPYRVVAVHADSIELQWHGRTLRLSLYPDANPPPEPHSSVPAQKLSAGSTSAVPPAAPIPSETAQRLAAKN